MHPAKFVAGMSRHQNRACMTGYHRLKSNISALNRESSFLVYVFVEVSFLLNKDYTTLTPQYLLQDFNCPLYAFSWRAFPSSSIPSQPVTFPKFCSTLPPKELAAGSLSVCCFAVYRTGTLAWTQRETLETAKAG